MVNWVRTLTQPQWRVQARACLGLHESHDGKPQFPGNDCAFSSPLESYSRSPSTWDGHVKHGPRPLRSHSAARAACQLTHVRANKYEAWGNGLRLAWQGWRSVPGLATRSQVAHHMRVSAASDCDEPLGLFNITSPNSPPRPTSKYIRNARTPQDNQQMSPQGFK